MFIAIEGIDGSGKTTLAEYLSKELMASGFRIFLTKEPTERFEISEEESASHDPDTAIKLFFRFTEDRYKHQSEILNHSKRGEIVISDRYLASSLAYQGALIEPVFGDRTKTLEWMKQVSMIITVRPDFTIYLDAAPEEAIKRINSRKNFSGFEDAGYLLRVREYYKSTIPEGSLVLDSSKGIEKVRQKALEFISGKLES